MTVVKRRICSRMLVPQTWCACTRMLRKEVYTLIKKQIAMQIAISICSSNLQKKYRDLSELYVRQLSMRSDRGLEFPPVGRSMTMKGPSYASRQLVANHTRVHTLNWLPASRRVWGICLSIEPRRCLKGDSQ